MLSEITVQEQRNTMFIKALKDGVVPATGCTEPVAVAFGAAKCMPFLKDKTIDKLEVKVSPNVMKNAMAVTVPGTGKPGLLIAAAAGALVGDPEAGLSVIERLNKTDVPKIVKLAYSGKVTAGVANVDDDLYVEVGVSNQNEAVRIYIAGDHTNIYLIKVNNQITFSKPKPDAHQITESQKFLKTTTFREVWDFAHNVDLESIRFMKHAGDLNMALAQEGLNHSYGLSLERSFENAKKIGFGSGENADLSNKMIAITTAASDARMGGAQLAAMSNSGSGNQGISATCPVCVAADYVHADEEQLIRTLTLSHLTALYIHSFLPVLSAFCATDSAAMGAAAAVVDLFDGDFDQASIAIKNMAGDAVGMICDGAGCSCAMKVATSVSSMYRCVNLALQNIAIPASNGMVSEDIDETIHGVGKLGTQGMKETDLVILNFMMSKTDKGKSV